MKKAMMYLLLALGITLVVIFIGGAMVGLIAGFIDGFSGNKVGTTTSMSVMVYAGSASVILLCVILNWVFLKLGFAKYSLGRIPKNNAVRVKVAAGMILAMAGMAVLHCLMMDVTKNFESDALISESYAWMRQHPVYSILILVIIEATGNLVIYGAILREILEWKHRPAIVVPVFAAIMGVFSLLGGNPMLMLPSFLVAQIEGCVYEYTRSIIPLIIGDVAFWIVMLCLGGLPTQGWWFFIAVALAAPGALLALNPMEPYKPID